MSLCLLIALSLALPPYPAPDAVAPETPEFTNRYNLNNVPNLPLASPRNSGPAVNCATGKTCTFCSGCIRDEIVSCVNRNHWALTFDDGPTSSTLKVLDWLDKNGKKAIFFVTGTNAQRNRNVLTSIAQGGHEIGIHTWCHHSLTSMTTATIIAEIDFTAQIIEEITGKRPKYARPPYGDIDDRVRAIMRAMGLTPVLWNFDTQDYQLNNNPNALPVMAIENAASDRAKQWQSASVGVISLQHDLSDYPVNHVPSVSASIENNGMKIVDFYECIGAVPPGPSVDPTTTSVSTTTTTTTQTTTTTTTTTSIASTSTTTTIITSTTGKQTTTTSKFVSVQTIPMLQSSEVSKTTFLSLLMLLLF